MDSLGELVDLRKFFLDFFVLRMQLCPSLQRATLPKDLVTQDRVSIFVLLYLKPSDDSLASDFSEMLFSGVLQRSAYVEKYDEVSL